MNKKATIILVLMITILVVSFTHRISYDNRSASNLSAYCNIDFRGIPNPLTARIDNATLSIIDFRFSGQPLKKFCILNIDGEKYKIDAIESLFSPPTYSIQYWQSDQCFKYSNILKFQFSEPILEKIRYASMIKVLIQYDNNDSAIELPLSDPDLHYWKSQL